MEKNERSPLLIVLDSASFTSTSHRGRFVGSLQPVAGDVADADADDADPSNTSVFMFSALSFAAAAPTSMCSSLIVAFVTASLSHAFLLLSVLLLLLLLLAVVLGLSRVAG